MSLDIFVYRMDHNDTIISVSENWCAFATENAWAGAVSPEGVVGHKLWDFIQGIETRHLYQELIRRVRGAVPSQLISFRCDSPDERRYLELFIEAMPEDQIQNTSRILRTETRPPVRLLDANAPRSKDKVSICSMCKKVKVSPDQWVELEEGLAYLKIFEEEEIPLLSHGLCPQCFEETMRDLDAIRAP